MKEEGKFYSVWRREKTPLGIFHKFAAQKGKGHYVGTIHQAQGLRPGMTLFFEGDDSTYVDNKMRLHGTGSEDYYNGGWYALLDRWDRGNSLPPPWLPGLFASDGQNRWIPFLLGRQNVL